METTTGLQAQLSEAFENFLQELDTVSPEQFNAEPKQGNWTIGQLTQHMVLGTTGLPDKKNEKADRPADRLESEIREVFLNDTLKLQPPQPLVPEKRKYDKEMLITQLKNNKDLLLKIINEEQLDFFCMEMKLSVWGYLTRYEWIKLDIYHLQRHLKQLKRLKNTFK